MADTRRTVRGLLREARRTQDEALDAYASMLIRLHAAQDQVAGLKGQARDLKARARQVGVPAEQVSQAEQIVARQYESGTRPAPVEARSAVDASPVVGFDDAA